MGGTEVAAQVTADGEESLPDFSVTDEEGDLPYSENPSIEEAMNALDFVGKELGPSLEAVDEVNWADLVPKGCTSVNIDSDEE